MVVLVPATEEVEKKIRRFELKIRRLAALAGALAALSASLPGSCDVSEDIQMLAELAETEARDGVEDFDSMAADFDARKLQLEKLSALVAA